MHHDDTLLGWDPADTAQDTAPGCGELPRRDWAWERRQASGRAGTFFGEAAAGAASGKTQRNCLRGGGRSGQPPRDRRSGTAQ